MRFGKFDNHKFRDVPRGRCLPDVRTLGGAVCQFNGSVLMITGHLSLTLRTSYERSQQAVSPNQGIRILNYYRSPVLDFISKNCVPRKSGEDMPNPRVPLVKSNPTKNLPSKFQISFSKAPNLLYKADVDFFSVF